MTTYDEHGPTTLPMALKRAAIEEAHGIARAVIALSDSYDSYDSVRSNLPGILNRSRTHGRRIGQKLALRIARDIKKDDTP